MIGKTKIVWVLIALAITPTSAWSASRYYTGPAAGWSRGDCINATQQVLGSYSTDSGRGTMNRAAVRRCMKYGPNAVY
jgi:hypothetical protein